jgi:diadenosine tetraphosphatase ApaH/serine/threonine PP2A family protein phosphatase
VRVLAVGDIHTKLWIIMGVERIINNYDMVVFVGDYADDWGATSWDSLYTWGALMELQSRYPEKVKCVTGNHDYIYANYTKTTQSGYDRLTQTMIDMPENRKIRDWLRKLPISINVDDVTYSHAGIIDGWEERHGLWNDDSPIWARPGRGSYLENAPQVFGHTPSRTCMEIQKNVWCIDTFSTYPDGTPIGDHTVLEVIDGKTFKKIKMETKNDNNYNPSSI